MGMQASAALLLKSLIENEDKWLHKDAVSMVEKFSLFAIILADPVKDPGFYNFIQKEFSFFNRLTGDNFLFFSIIKDAQYQQRNKQFKFRQFSDLEAYKHNNAAEKVNNSELAIHAICTIMGIDYDETPCLIVSNDLRFGQFCKLDTNINILEKQLKELSSVADYLKGDPLEKSLKGLLIKFNETSQVFSKVESLDIDKNIMSVVSEVLQCVTGDQFFNNKRTDDFKARIVNKYAFGEIGINEDRLDEALALLNVYRSKENVIHDNFSAEYSMEERDQHYSIKDNEKRFNNVSGNLNIGWRLPRYLLDDWENIQSATRNYLKTADILSNYSSRIFRYSNDYSVYTFPLCKAFEKEINLSVVQFLRREKGVPMPNFFDRYHPQSDAIPVKPSPELIPNPREIYLNKLSAGKWLPPGLGESRIVFASLRLDNPALATDWEAKDKLDLLNKNWTNIYKIRNMTTHSDPVPGSQKDLLENSMLQLNENGLLNSLTRLKMQLRQ